MRRLLVGLMLVITALILTIFIGQIYQRMGSEYILYEGVGPGMDSTLVVVGGWPFPYLYDTPYFSPVGSVHFTSGILGEDDLRIWPFLGDVAFYMGALFLVYWGLRRFTIDD